MSRETKTTVGTLAGAPPAAVWAAGTFQTVLGAVISAYIATRSVLVTSLAVAAALTVALAVLWTTRHGRLVSLARNLGSESHETPACGT